MVPPTHPLDVRPAMTVWCNHYGGCKRLSTGREGVVNISKLSCTQKAMLLLFKCFDIKKVKSLKDSISIDRVLGGKPTKKKKKKKKIKSKYKFGLSEATKDLMKKRDSTRKKLSSAAQQEKKTLLEKYKKLRNQINQRIRKETRNFNNARIDEAKNENEMWKVVNDVIKPKKGSEWRMNYYYYYFLKQPDTRVKKQPIWVSHFYKRLECIFSAVKLLSH